MASQLTKMPELSRTLAILAGFIPLCLTVLGSSPSCKMTTGHSGLFAYAPVGGHVLKNHLESTQRLPSPEACFLACLVLRSRPGAAGCKSVNYHRDDGSHLCELNSADSREWPKDLIAQEGVIFVEVSNGVRPKNNDPQSASSLVSWG